MKKRIVAILLAGAVMLCTAGCGDIFAWEYTYSTDYKDETAYDSIEGGADVKSVPQLRKAILDLIDAGEEEGMLRFSNYNGNPADDLAAVCFDIRTVTPLAAYAVSSIDYELSRIVSYYTADIKISYSRTPEEIAAVRPLSRLAELRTEIDTMLENGESGMVFRIYSTIVNDSYVEKLVYDRFLSNPLVLLNEPTAHVVSYPEDGAIRIYEVSTSYALENDAIEPMRDELDAAMADVSSLIRPDNGGYTALNCASYLSGKCSYDGSNGGTAYDALVKNTSGSRGIALAYEAMCNALGVPCRVVQGKLGTFGTAEHYWNIIELDGSFYHVDISRMKEEVINNVFLATDDVMWGLYTWEPENYPSCDGNLSYDDLINAAVNAEEGTADENGNH